MSSTKGRVTIPTDLDVIPQTLELMEKWGADAVRDCDGTDFPRELQNVDGKIYSTYYTTRKDNGWAKAHPEEIQQMYVMTPFYMSETDVLRIPLMKGLYPDMLKPNSRDDITRWWEVIDRTTGQIVSTEKWSYEESTGEVTVLSIPFHDYTVSFLAYIIWDPVHMYNAVTNGWKDVEHQITFDVRQPKTHEFTMKRLRKFIEEHPYVNVLRFTTFFHQFTLIFDELAREKYVDWYGYSASVSPYILEQFERECGYKFRPEYIIDQGYYNGQYRIPTREFRDFQVFQRREVSKIAREMVDITHECGKEAMMFLGDHWIGTEPFLEEFASIGLDAVVGSVGGGATLRLISEIPGVRYTEGRFLPYFFPDTFYEGNDPCIEAKDNWRSARRALMRKPVDRIGYGGYLSLAYRFPKFVDYIEQVTDEFREIYQRIGGSRPYCGLKVAILNCWGKLRSWQAFMVAHALWYKQTYSYFGILEALSGMAVDVVFLSFDDIREHGIDKDIDVIINAGAAGTAFSGGEEWLDEKIVTAVRRFVYQGGGFLGVGEPCAVHFGGRYFQLADVLGVDKELGFSLSTDKYFTRVKEEHFLSRDRKEDFSFGESMHNVYALSEETEIVEYSGHEVHLSAHAYGKGRGIYLAGLPYSDENTRLLLRCLYYSASREENLSRWYADNPYCEVHAYPEQGSYAVVNNSSREQKTLVYNGDGKAEEITLADGEIIWKTI